MRKLGFVELKLFVELVNEMVEFKRDIEVWLVSVEVELVIKKVL